MRYLLDTHVLLWLLAADPRVKDDVVDTLRDPDVSVHVSAASAWEIAIKSALGKLEAPHDLRARLYASRVDPLSITVEHALAAGALPRHHGDPFDRMLVAQARLERLVLVTSDPRLGRYDVDVMPAS